MPIGVHPAHQTPEYRAWLKAKWGIDVNLTDQEASTIMATPEDQRKIRLIGLLRAKAASTTFPAERDALLAKVTQLEMP